jgi:hypothetical protein
MAKALFNIGDKIIGADATGEAILFKNRVVADGGTLETFNETDALIRKLHEENVYKDVTIGLVAGAYKADKWYSFKGSDMDVVRATSGTRVNRSGVLTTEGNNIVRADYDGGVLKGNNVEPSATNLWLYSEPASATGYTATNVEFVSENLAGTVDAVRLADASVSRSLQQNIGNRQGQTLTISFYVKVGAGVLPNQGSGSYRDFTLTIDGNDVLDYTQFKYEDIGNGVYRVLYTRTFSSTNINAVIRKYSGLNNNTSVVFSRIQLETGSVATSYIKTTASTATRNADNISKTGISSEIGQTEGAVLVEGNVRNTSVSRAIIALGDSAGNVNSRVRIGINASNILYGQVAGVIRETITPVDTRFVILLSKSAVGFDVFYNGVKYTSATGATSITIDSMRVGYFEGLTNVFNDHIRSVTLFNKAIPEATAIRLTT